MWTLLVTLAHAELPPPDYRSTTDTSAADAVDQLARDQGMPAAEAFVDRWERQVGASARVAYELGLAWRLAGDDKKARTAFDRALAADPDLVEARYDRGEVELNAGELSAAEDDFSAVVRLQPDAWPGHFRLADIAARRGDAAAFEAHLVRALRLGFTVRVIASDPRWKGYLQDPALGPILTRLVTVYAGDDTLQLLQSPP